MSFAARGEARDMEFATTQKQRYIQPSSRRSAAPRFSVSSVFPRWLMGLFRCLDFLSPLMIETNSSFVSVS